MPPVSTLPSAVPEAAVRERAPLRQRVASWLLDPAGVGFAMLLATSVLAPLNRIRVTGAIAASDVPLFIAGLALVIAVAARRTRLWLPPGLLAVLAMAVVSVFMQNHESGGVGADFIIWMIFMLCMLGIPLLYANAPGASWPRLHLLFRVWLLGASFGALACVLQSRGISLGPLDRWLVYIRPRFAGLTMHPNNLATMSALAFPGCVLLAVTARRLAVAALWAVCAFLCLWSINLSGSRSGLLAPMPSTLLILGLYLGYQHMSRMALLRIVVGGLALLVVLFMKPEPVPGGPVGQSAFERAFVDDTTAKKADFARELQGAYSELRFETEPVFGTGWSWVRLSHVHHLGLLESGGALGLLFFLVHQLVIAYAGLLALLAHGRDPERAKVVFGLVAAWITFTTLGFANPLLLERYCYIPMGLLLLASRLRFTATAEVEDTSHSPLLFGARRPGPTA